MLIHSITVLTEWNIQGNTLSTRHSSLDLIYAEPIETWQHFIRHHPTSGQFYPWHSLRLEFFSKGNFEATVAALFGGLGLFFCVVFSSEFSNDH
jgi:hypothetical protein